MKFLFSILVLLSCSVHAQSGTDKQEVPRSEAAIGSVHAPPPKGAPLMYPSAASEQKEVAPQVEPIPAAQLQRVREWSNIEVYLTFGILIFTLIVLGMLVHLARNAAKPWSPQSILRVFGITLIIPLAVLLIVAGYSEKQIASVVGLLGVVAGYLLGNADRPRVGA